MFKLSVLREPEREVRISTLVLVQSSVGGVSLHKGWRVRVTADRLEARLTPFTLLFEGILKVDPVSDLLD